MSTSDENWTGHLPSAIRYAQPMPDPSLQPRVTAPRRDPAWLSLLGGWPVRGSLETMTRIGVFGAGAMGTAFAMHLARQENRVALWASPFDEAILATLIDERRHPALPEHLPESLSIMSPDELEAAAKDLDLAIMGAHSGGARTLARLVLEGCEDELPLVVGVAKGLEPETGKRMSEVYAEEFGHDRVVTIGGPCLAGEVAQGLPTAAVFAALNTAAAESAAGAFRSATFKVSVTDDVVGVELCTVAKNIAAIGMGILDGLANVSGLNYSNAKAAVFTQGVRELSRFVVALGGRPETANGLAGMGDVLVTSLGGRNRLYGELIGEGSDPAAALTSLLQRGMTVEGVSSAEDVGKLIDAVGMELPLFAQIRKILFQGAAATSLLDCLDA
jgi:glycerol-3-phosphate dehydrogenase (NAD(P)+)